MVVVVLEVVEVVVVEVVVLEVVVLVVFVFVCVRMSTGTCVHTCMHKLNLFNMTTAPTFLWSLL